MREYLENRPSLGEEKEKDEEGHSSWLQRGEDYRVRIIWQFCRQIVKYRNVEEGCH